MSMCSWTIDGIINMILSQRGTTISDIMLDHSEVFFFLLKISSNWTYSYRFQIGKHPRYENLWIFNDYY